MKHEGTHIVAHRMGKNGAFVLAQCVYIPFESFLRLNSFFFFTFRVWILLCVRNRPRRCKRARERERKSATEKYGISKWMETIRKREGTNRHKNHRTLFRKWYDRLLIIVMSNSRLNHFSNPLSARIPLKYHDKTHSAIHTNTNSSTTEHIFCFVLRKIEWRWRTRFAFLAIHMNTLHFRFSARIYLFAQAIYKFCFFFIGAGFVDLWDLY